jgi:hypothetical protein
MCVCMAKRTRVCMTKKNTIYQKRDILQYP